jgi:hypothetical protein
MGALAPNYKQKQCDNIVSPVIQEKISLEKLTTLVESSPVKRAIYYGKTGRWYSMPGLKNYSNYNRDTQTDLKRQNESELEERKKQLQLIFDKSVSMKDSALNHDAALILDWLINNRKGEWIKFKGKEGRDMNFIKFLSLQKIDCERRDNSIKILLENDLIELSNDENEIKHKNV